MSSITCRNFTWWNWEIKSNFNSSWGNTFILWLRVMVGKNLKVFPLSSYSGGVVILLGTLGPDRVRKKNTSLAGTDGYPAIALFESNPRLRPSLEAAPFCVLKRFWVPLHRLTVVQLRSLVWRQNRMRTHRYPPHATDMSLILPTIVFAMKLIATMIFFQQ